MYQMFTCLETRQLLEMSPRKVIALVLYLWRGILASVERKASSDCLESCIKHMFYAKHDFKF